MAFEYQPLDLSKKQIRLLHLKPAPDRGGDRGALAAACELHTFDFDPATIGEDPGLPHYTALSYAWGSNDHLKVIVLNRQLFQVRENLYDFLSSTAAELQDTWLWIDQLCVDQQNNAERSSQVSMIADIYSNAEEVIVWLGALNEGQKDTALALEFVKWAQSDPHMREITDPDRMNRSLYAFAIRQYNAWVRPRPYKCDIKAIKRARELVRAIPYWKRMWIVQEFVLAKKLRIRWGPQWLSMKNLWGAEIEASLRVQTPCFRHASNARWSIPHLCSSALSLLLLLDS